MSAQHAQSMGRLARLADSDLAHSFVRSPVAMLSALVALICILGAVLAPWIAPHDPFDLATLNLSDSFRPPLLAGGGWAYPLGTDDQGRDILSAIMYGARISLGVGALAVVVSALVGVTVGLLSGYLGGLVDAALMRISDVQLTFPAILVALLVDGVVNAALPNARHARLELFVVVFSIGISNWPQFARTVRGSTMVERSREYVQAARVIGVPGWRIMVSHILPNVLSPVLVIATISLALAIVTEATLSFLGVGLPPTEPSLGTLILAGNNYLFSGDWWMTVFPGAALVLMVVSINLLGDWLRDALNPRLR